MATLYRIYIDDSGNVDRSTTNTPETRYGSITAVILEADYLDKKFNDGFRALSIKHFGAKADGSAHNLHRRVLASPPDHGPFSVLKDESLRSAWDASALKMFGAAQYTVITACVDKVHWYYRYPTWDGDFYEVLVQTVLERAFYFLNNRSGVAEVNIETKGHRDERVEEQYKKCLQDGFNKDITAEKLRSIFTSREINIVQKSHGWPGAQLADLLAGPSLRHIRSISSKGHKLDGSFTKSLCEILEKEKYYREKWSGPHGYGRVWRPKL